MFSSLHAKDETNEEYFVCVRLGVRVCAFTCVVVFEVCVCVIVCLCIHSTFVAWVLVADTINCKHALVYFIHLVLLFTLAHK